MLFLRLTLALLSVTAFAAGPLEFRITLDPALRKEPVSGRLIVFMTDRMAKVTRLEAGFIPGQTWLAAQEVTLRPGEPFRFAPIAESYPQPFAEAPAKSYQFMALLDVDHSYSYNGENETDLLSPVTPKPDLNPAQTEPIELTLSVKGRAPREPESNPLIQIVSVESKLLTAFWGRPISVRAGLVLPPKYEKDLKARYPAVYLIHGFGGNHRGAWFQGQQFIKEMEEGKRPAMVTVFLDASFSTGHHVFADSVNNGPWGAALTQELIPFIEQMYRVVPKPYARFLTGHSSGGWSSLWLQVTYPDFFGGTWSTAPDSVDFRSFTGINATSGSTDNAYRNADGSEKNLVRMNGKNVASMEQFVKSEQIKGPVGGQMASFDWVFSPRGPDGRPLQLFNRETGIQNPDVQKYWERYDIRLIVERNWKTLGPKLLGKLHLTCGDQDNFHLEEAFIMMCQFLRSKGREDACEIVPGRDHMNLYRADEKRYPDGLSLRIAREMWQAYERAAPKSKSKPKTKNAA
jgi:hypothetical protein